MGVQGIFKEVSKVFVKQMISLKVLRPNANEVRINDVRLFFSYETLMGYVNPNGTLVYRDKIDGSKPSKTTMRHLRDFYPDNEKVYEIYFLHKVEDILKWSK